MRALCCLDGSNLAQIDAAVTSLLQTTQLTLGLIYVLDDAPQRDLERQRQRFFRMPLTSSRLTEIQQAEQEAAYTILTEGRLHFPLAETLRRAGQPEREIVQTAATWHADLILLTPRSIQDHNLAIGPRSVGHIARFVLDHAPCPVLLIRPNIQDTFSLPG